MTSVWLFFQVMQWSLQHIQSPRWCFHFQKCAGSPSLLRRHWILPVYQRHKQTRLQRSAPCRVWRPRPVAPLWEGMMVRARLRMASPSLPCPRTRSVVHWMSSFHVFNHNATIARQFTDFQKYICNPRTISTHVSYQCFWGMWSWCLSIKKVLYFIE